MNLKSFTNQEYKRYCLADGSQYIVSEFALWYILKLIEKYNIEKILEVGVGIGTISGSILKYAKLQDLRIEISGTEENTFCLAQIPYNLKSEYTDLKIYRDLKNLPDGVQYELIIIDGSEENLSEIKYMITSHGLVVIEGDRAGQVKLIRQFFPNSKSVQIISLARNGEYSVKKTGDYQGGLTVVFTDPSLRQFFHWLILKIMTKLKIYKRKLSKWTGNLSKERSRILLFFTTNIYFKQVELIDLAIIFFKDDNDSLVKRK